jgi:UDP-hydrolysing UDP-N-acetyl-D-glucosamine 2-epimerase
MRTITVVTVGRSDFGIYRPVLRAIQEAPDLSLRLVASGMHLAPEFGHTVDAIEAEGFEVAERVEMLVSSDTPEGVAKSIGLGVIGFSQSLARSRPDVLLVLGDRFEMYAAAIAALPFRIPIAHIHGGEVTEGAIDDAIRHSITKLSHLHFTSTQAYADRIIRMGEEPWRVSVSGAPSLDNLAEIEVLGPEALQASLGMHLEQPFVLATYHPATLENQSARAQMDEVIAAVAERDMPVVFTMPNADPGGREVSELIRAFTGGHERVFYVENLGTQAYFSVMANAALMLGNSSSGIIEACSFGLPVVNIGTRQQGRVRGSNVIDVACERAAIIAGINQALDPAFRRQIEGSINPYGGGEASKVIIGRLKGVELGAQLITKRFHDGA